MGEVRLICGTERSDRSARIDELMREHWGRGVLLVPTRQYAARRAERIILEGGLDGAWGRPVRTMDDFATDLIRAAGKEPARLRDWERRLLLDRALADGTASGALRTVGAAGATTGFRAHLLRVITQLKQAAVDPDAFRRRVETRARRSVLDAVVADVYAAYQRALREADVYDLPGLFWEADLLCRSGRPALLTDVDALLLDGFDDFTPSELRLLDAVAQHVGLVAFGLNYDPNPNRKDLYALTARTAAHIRERLGAQVAYCEEPAARTFTEFASSAIFWRDRPRVPEGLRPDLEIVACADTTQEVETIGRRVKALLIDGHVSPDAIAVAYRNLRGVAGPLRSVFGEFGIPLRVIEETALWDSSICGFLMTLMDAVDTWTHEAVVDTLTSHWFSENDPCAKAIPLLARVAQVVSGRDEWRRRADHLIARIESGSGEDIEQLLESMPTAREAASALRAGLDALDGLRIRLPEKGAPAAFAAAIDGVIDALRIEDRVETHPSSRIRESERAALAALRDLLGEWQTWGDGSGPAQPRAEFLAAWRQALQETTFSMEESRDGVVCLDVESIRHLQFDYVFFGGADEGEVPRPPSVNAIYAEEDVESLAAAGIPIEGRRAHSEREALLFHHVLDAARKRLCITWRGLSRRGQEQYPSPYVTDVADLFPGAEVQQSAGVTGFVPDLAQAASWRDVRNAAFSTAPAVRGAFRDRFAPMDAGAAIENARHDHTPFGIYDGVLADSALIETSGAAFGEQHRFSVQQVETYTACPFRFFVERMLEVASVEAPVAEFDARVRGVIIHAVLQAFHERYRGRSIPEIADQEAQEAMGEIAAREFEARVRWSVTAPRGVETVELRRLMATIGRYLRVERKRNEAQWKPAHFEVAFGDVRRDTADGLTRSEAYPLATPAGTVLFSGRIDRVDRQDQSARILDYKSGAPPTPGAIREGESLQLQVYALALEEFLMTGARCGEAWFVQVGRTDRVEALGRAKKTDEWPERQARAREIVAACVTGMRAGRFPPTPSDKACAYCGARRVCRYEPGRVERKEARP